MTKEQLAAILNGREVGMEISRREEKLAKENGLVVVFKLSHYTTSFRGAIRDEYSSYAAGIPCYLNEYGVWDSRCKDEYCHYLNRERKKCKTIREIWYDDGDPHWRYETDIPHSVFEIMDDDDVFCRGIVFEKAALGGDGKEGDTE